MEKGKISLNQFTVMVFILTLGDSILVLPSAVIYGAKQDAWISGIVSIIFGMGLCFLFYKLGSLHPGKTFIESCQSILGKWFGKMLGSIFVLYSLISVALLLRELGDFLGVNYFEETPIEVIMALFVLTVTLAVRVGIETIGRTAEIFLPWIIALLFFSIIMLIGQMEFNELLPVFENGVKPIMNGSIPFISFPYLETVILLMFYPFVKEQTIKYKHLFWATFMGGLVLLLVTFLSLVVLGVESASNSLYPTLKLAQKIKIGTFIQRLDVLVATLWLFTIFFKAVFYFYAAVMGLAQLLGVKEYRFITFPVAFIAIPLALNVSANIVDLNEKLVRIWPFFDLTVGLCIPFFLLMVGLYRKKRKSPITIN